MFSIHHMPVILSIRDQKICTTSKRQFSESSDPKDSNALFSLLCQSSILKVSE